MTYAEVTCKEKTTMREKEIEQKFTLMVKQRAV
jgi:hypothetical protein